MKTFNLLFLLSTVFLISCSKDEKSIETQTTGDLIIGSWNIVEWELRDGTDSIDDQQLATFTAVGRDFVGGLTFNSDGSMLDNLGFAVDGERIVVGLPPEIETQNFSPSNYTGTYQLVSDNEITLSGNPDQVYTISAINSSSMSWAIVLKNPRVEGVDTIIATATNVMRFEKN